MQKIVYLFILIFKISSPVTDEKQKVKIMSRFSQQNKGSEKSVVLRKLASLQVSLRDSVIEKPRVLYNWGQCIAIIKRGIKHMKNDGFDLFYSSNNQDYNLSLRKDNQYWIKRNPKLYFQCLNSDCPQKQKEKWSPYWTSHSGLCAFSFFFDIRPRHIPPGRLGSMKYECILRFQFRLFSKSCRSCKQWGNPLLSRQSIETFKDIVTSTLKVLLIQNPSPLDKIMRRLPDLRPLMMKRQMRLLRHYAPGCEACQEGVCFWSQPERGNPHKVQWSCQVTYGNNVPLLTVCPQCAKKRGTTAVKREFHGSKMVKHEKVQDKGCMHDIKSIIKLLQRQ